MGKSKIKYLLTLIIILTFVLLIGGTFPYFLFYVFLLTFIIPFIHSLITLKNIKGSVKIPNKTLFSGEKINIEYEVINNSIFPITYLEIESHISKELTGVDSPNIVLSLGKKEAFVNKETIHLKRRGYYQIGNIIVIIQDVFGFFRFKKKITSQTSLLVYPEIINLSTFKVTASNELGELLIPNPAFQDKSRVTALREYTQGDSLKSIHWKLTAKQDILIVKDYKNRGDTSLTILIDNEAKLFNNDVNRRLEDKIVDTALSIASFCLNQNIELRLETQDGKNHVEIQGQQKYGLRPFLEALAKFHGNGAYNFKFILRPRIETLKKGSTIIITPNLDKTMGTHGFHLKLKNLNPLFIVITDIENQTGCIDNLIKKKLAEEGITVYIIDYKTSIKEVLEGAYEQNTG